MARFSGELSPGLSKPARRFVEEMLYGIQAAQNVKLIEIGRSLGEAVPLIKTVKRLSENLIRLELRGVLAAAVVLGRQSKLKILVGHALTAAKRLFGIPDFCYSAVADGLHAIFSRYPRRSRSLLTHPAHASPPLPRFDPGYFLGKVLINFLLVSPAALC